MAKIPATVITGFLGAGKTTLVQHLLTKTSGKRIALIINEFGDVGVDRELVKGCADENCPADSIVELANGCICCTVADEFLPTMQALLDRPVPPDHIIIETSGLALPKPLVKAFQWPDVRTRATVDGVVTLIDAAAVAAGRFATDEEALEAARKADPTLDHDNPLEELFEDQLACADLVLLNKADLVDADTLAEIETKLRLEVRPGTKLVRTDHGAIDPAIVLGLAIGAEDDLESRPSHHDQGEPHDHDDFDSFVITGGEVADLPGLLTVLEATIRTHDVLRLKGVVALHDKPMRLMVQGVGPRVQHHFDRAWATGEPHRTQLVVIGLKGLDRTAVASAIHGAIG